ncbi:MAG: nuclear transport factor 2 family protein [Desulfobacterota bacterium]|nr:nuclear transport factor 2 family protein [Thermodesulfobacteriota bacterium]
MNFTKQIDAAQSLFYAMNTRNVEVLEEHLAEDAVFDFPGVEPIHGARKIVMFLKVLFRKYPRLTFTIEDIIHDGERLAVVWHNEGENTLRMPYRNRGVTIIRIVNDKIFSISDYFKDTSFVSAQHRRSNTEGV